MPRVINKKVIKLTKLKSAVNLMGDAMETADFIRCAIESAVSIAPPIKFTADFNFVSFITFLFITRGTYYFTELLLILIPNNSY